MPFRGCPHRPGDEEDPVEGAEVLESQPIFATSTDGADRNPTWKDA